MSNRFARGVGGSEPYRPRGALTEGLDQIDRSGRLAESEAQTQVGAQLANLFGGIADDMAQVEGQREGRIAGNDTAYRPQGLTTIRGKAFEKAAEATYLDNLDARMRTGMSEVYDQNRNDPAALKAALDKFKEGLLEGDAFPEIRGAVNASFERLRLPFEVRAGDASRERVNDEARAARLNRDVAGEAYRARTAEASPGDPRAAEILAGELQKEQAADKQEVAAGRMSAEDAQRRAIARRQDVNTRQAVAQIGKIESLEDLDRHEQQFEKNRKEGKDPVFQDSRVMDAVDAALAKRRQQLTTEGKRVNSLADKTADDMLTRAENGLPPSTNEIAGLRAAAQTPEQRAIVDRYDRRAGLINVLNARGPEAIEGIAAQARRALPNPTKEQADEIKWIEDLAQRRRSAVASDPVRVVRQTSAAPVEDLVLDNPAQLAEGLRKRAAVAGAVPGTVNPKGRMLQDEEVRQLRLMVDKGDDKAEATLRALVDGAGKDAPRLLSEIGGKAPEMAQAGLLLLNGRTQAAREVLAGIGLRNVEGGAKPVEPHGDTFNKAWRKVVGDALIDNPNDAQRIRKTAEAMAVHRLRRLDSNKDGAAASMYEDVIQSALGRDRRGTTDFGGVAKVQPGYWRSYPVVVPPDVKADRFKSVIDAVRDEDLAGMAVPPREGTTVRQLRQAVPIAVPGGYRFALGEPNGNDPQFIRGRDGAPFVLRWGDISPELRKRVPGAFEGSE